MMFVQELSQHWPQIPWKTTPLKEITGHIPQDTLKSFLQDIKTHDLFHMNQLIDMVGLDLLHYKSASSTLKPTPRFQVIYNLLSMTRNKRIRITVDSDAEETFPSVSSIFTCALWYEREIYDLLGLHFTEHPHLKRLMLPQDFQGHPLRKDFPVEGHTQWGYNAKTKRLEETPYHPDTPLEKPTV